MPSYSVLSVVVRLVALVAIIVALLMTGLDAKMTCSGVSVTVPMKSWPDGTFFQEVFALQLIFVFVAIALFAMAIMSHLDKMKRMLILEYTLLVAAIVSLFIAGCLAIYCGGQGIGGQKCVIAQFIVSGIFTLIAAALYLVEGLWMQKACCGITPGHD